MASVEAKTSLQGTYRKKLLFVSLIVIVVLLASLCVYLAVNRGVSVHVSDHVALVEVINDVKMTRLTIILDNDIQISPLIDRIVIPTGKDITFTSNSKTEFFKLIGIFDNTLTVEDGGVLRLDVDLTKQAF